MAKQLQLRRGTTLQNNAFIGAVGEPTLDTETGMIHIHDGVTQGGKDFIDPVVAFQKPTAGNGYTWYRKYASGWVEQGGMGPSVAPGGQAIINFPVTMTDTNYTLLFGLSNAGAKIVAAITRTVSSATVESYAVTGSASVVVNWEVKGFAA